MKSLLIVIKDEQLAKGIALGVLDYYQSIHLAKSPYEAVQILQNEIADTVITNINFPTMDPQNYINKIIDSSGSLKRVFILKDAPIKLNIENFNCDIIIKESSISIKNIIELIDTIKNKSEGVKKL